MSTLDVAAAATSRPGRLASLLTLYRLLLRTQISVPRLLGIAGLGALSLVIGLFARWDANPDQAAADAISGYGLGILVPVATLWLATSAIGDLVEDRLLVYLSLKPVPRWQLPAAAVLAPLSVVVPLAVLPLAASALVAGAPDVGWPALLAALLAALAYAGLFAAAGLWFRRAIWWGLAFVLIWENAVAYTVQGAARFTVIGWASSVLALAPDVDVQLEAGSAAAAIVVLVAIAIAGWLAATWHYGRVDID
jgi:ABC-2 type transport system permease protein